MAKANLLWVDLEMTGLDPQVDQIIEVAAIATTSDLAEVARYSASVRADRNFMLQRMATPFWQDHAASHDHLIQNSTSVQAKPASLVEQELVKFIATNFDTSQPIYLAGNSVHQDRKFITKTWPQVDQLLNYRLLDVSSWKIIFEHHNIKFAKKECHRALDDIEESIAELQYYLKKVTF